MRERSSVGIKATEHLSSWMRRCLGATRQRSPVSISGVTVFWIALYLVTLVVFRDYIFSKMLYLDDAIYVGRAMFGQDINPPANFLSYWLMGALEDLAGLSGLKIAAIGTPIFTGFFLSLILIRVGADPVLAIMFSLLATQYPIAPDVTFFVTGGHGRLLAACCMLLLLLTVLAVSAEKHAQVVLLVCAGALAVMATKLSPLGTLVPLGFASATFLFFGLWQRSDRQLSDRLLLIALAIWPLILSSFFYQSYHYASRPGLIDQSLGQIIQNLGRAFSTISEVAVAGIPLLSLGIVLCLALLAIGSWIALRRYRFGPIDRLAPSGGPVISPLHLAIALVLLSALCFGPVSVLTRFFPRYIEASFALGLAAVFSALLSVLTLQPGLMLAWTRIIAVVAAAAVSLASYSLSITILSPYMASHNLIVAQTDARSWSDSDQFLIMLPQGSKTPTLATNHWSTWYLRVLTGNGNVIGLIGDPRYEDYMQENGLFVDRYEDHSSVFRREGGLGRLRMIGLERERPLFAFASTPGSRNLAPQNVLLWEGQETRLVTPGQRPGRVPAQEWGDLLGCTDFEGGLLPISIGAQFHEGSLEKLIDISPGAFDGSRAQNYDLSLSAERAFVISISLRPERVVALTDNGAARMIFGEHSPPMPLFAPGFVIYQSPDAFHYSDRVSHRLWVGQDSQAEAINGSYIHSAHIAGVDECYAALFANDKFLGFLKTAGMDGRWQFGLGFKQRYWKGDVERLEVSGGGNPRLSPVPQPE